MMLRRTSKRVKEVVDKMRLPAVVRLRRSFWGDARNGTEEAKLQFVLRQLAAMTARCRITTLALPECAMKEQDAKRLARVLAQCPALAHLDLSGNSVFGAAGAKRLAGVLVQCRELVHLNLSGNQIGPAGADSLAGVLGQCAALAHLDLSCNDMGSNPPRNRSGGAEKLAGVLAQCTALAHLDLSWNQIGDRDGQKLARVITECPALTYLNLRGNCFTSPPTRGRLRALWCGESCGDLFYKGKMEQKQMERDLEALKKLGRERGWSSAKKPAATGGCDVSTSGVHSWNVSPDASSSTLLSHRLKRVPDNPPTCDQNKRPHQTATSPIKLLHTGSFKFANNAQSNRASVAWSSRPSCKSEPSSQSLFFPHISHMWDDIIVELFEDIKAELKLRDEMTMTSVADLDLSPLLVHHPLDVLPELEGDGQEEAIEENVEFDVTKDQI
jgi:hypothetical protein